MPEHKGNQTTKIHTEILLASDSYHLISQIKPFGQVFYIIKDVDINFKT